MTFVTKHNTDNCKYSSGKNVCYSLIFYETYYIGRSRRMTKEYFNEIFCMMILYYCLLHLTTTLLWFKMSWSERSTGTIIIQHSC